MPGHTLVELTFVLLLIGVAASSMAPTARRLQERQAVAAAREAVVGVFSEARAAAIESGEASVRLAVEPPVAEAVSRGSTLRRVDLRADFGVALELSGELPSVEVRYDALGLGRLASLTMALRRDVATAVLVVSSYGRIRRR